MVLTKVGVRLHFCAQPRRLRASRIGEKEKVESDLLAKDAMGRRLPKAMDCRHAGKRGSCKLGPKTARCWTAMPGCSATVASTPASTRGRSEDLVTTTRPRYWIHGNNVTRSVNVIRCRRRRQGASTRSRSRRAGAPTVTRSSWRERLAALAPDPRQGAVRAGATLAIGSWR